MLKSSINIMLIALLVLIILVIYRKKTKDKFCMCKECKSVISQNDNFCKNCGIKLKADDKEIIIKKSNRRITIGIYALLGIIVISGIVGVYSYSQKGDLLYDLSGSTGVYAKKYDNTLSNADYWIVNCKALSDGTFKKSIKDKNVQKLIVESKTSAGGLILTVQSGKDVKEYDISDTNGEKVLDISEFDTGLLKLSISHPKSEHIFVCIKWE